MRIIKNKTLDDISKKMHNIEKDVSEQEKEKLGEEERQKLRHFDLCHVIRMEKYIRQGGDPTFGNLDGVEYTSEEFDYYLSHSLNDYTPEERYRQRKEAYYFHPSYIKMEKLDFWKDRANAKYCTGHQCIPNCPYYLENGRIEDEQVVDEWIREVEIVEIDEYRAELGDELFDSILRS